MCKSNILSHPQRWYGQHLLVKDDSIYSFEWMGEPQTVVKCVPFQNRIDKFQRRMENTSR